LRLRLRTRLFDMRLRLGLRTRLFDMRLRLRLRARLFEVRLRLRLRTRLLDVPLRWRWGFDARRGLRSVLMHRGVWRRLPLRHRRLWRTSLHRLRRLSRRAPRTRVRLVSRHTLLRHRRMRLRPCGARLCPASFAVRCGLIHGGRRTRHAIVRLRMLHRGGSVGRERRLLRARRVLLGRARASLRLRRRAVAARFGEVLRRVCRTVRRRDHG
jgi:hypothetical protein